MVNYSTIFIQKIGQSSQSTPMVDVDVLSFLDSYSAIASMRYSTPWADFDSVPDSYKYLITIYSAIQYWWSKAAEYTSKFDAQVGGSQGASNRASSMFDRAMQMIVALQEELEALGGLISQGSGDIIVGDLIRRSKFSGELIPRATDPAGNWLS